jgi:hypothetical protein
MLSAYRRSAVVAKLLGLPATSVNHGSSAPVRRSKAAIPRRAPSRVFSTPATISSSSVATTAPIVPLRTP